MDNENKKQPPELKEPENFVDISNKKCALCKKELAENGNVLIIKCYEGEDAILCGICKEHVDTIKTNAYEEDKKASVKYLNTYMTTCGNINVIKYLKAVISNNTSVWARQSNHSQSNIPQNSSSGWIKGLKVGAWITVAVIIIYGVIMGVVAFSEDDAMTGVIIIIVSPVAAFSAVALIMVFLEMAEDIKFIRNNTQK